MKNQILEKLSYKKMMLDEYKDADFSGAAEDLQDDIEFLNDLLVLLGNGRIL